MTSSICYFQTRIVNGIWVVSNLLCLVHVKNILSKFLKYHVMNKGDEKIKNSRACISRF